MKRNCTRYNVNFFHAQLQYIATQTGNELCVINVVFPRYKYFVRETNHSFYLDYCFDHKKAPRRTMSRKWVFQQIQYYWSQDTSVGVENQ